MEEPSYTSRRSLLNRIVGGAFAAGFGGFRPAEAGPVPAPEGLSPPENAEVTGILDGNTLELKGGNQLRLAGIETPRPELAPGDGAMAQLAEAATAALKLLVGAGPITLRFDAGKRDRYGRRLAQAFNAEGFWLQAGLVSAGRARVHGDGSNRLGLRALLQLESAARNAESGLWRHPAFAIRAADDPKLEWLAGSFQIVQGRVAAAVVLNGTGFINFGADRHTDLTLVLKSVDKYPGLDLGGPAMLDLSSLTSKLIRCRGWLDRYDGPRIDISHPEQIEVLEV
jgi:endonuclease YncB( thermonuclease family)